MSNQDDVLVRIDTVQAIIEEFLDREVILSDSDYKGYDTTGLAKRIIAALAVPE